MSDVDAETKRLDVATIERFFTPPKEHGPCELCGAGHDYHCNRYYEEFDQRAADLKVVRETFNIKSPRSPDAVLEIVLKLLDHIDVLQTALDEKVSDS